MTTLRFVHNYDIVFCDGGGHNHNGDNPMFNVPDDKVYAEGMTPGQYRIVCEEDLLNTTLYGCPDAPKKTSKIDSILKGQASNVRIRGKIPLLVDLVAVEAGTGHLVRVARSFAERVAVFEGKSAHVYKDTKGLRTVGIGFNMDKAGAKTEFDTDLGLPSISTRFADVRNGTADLTDSEMETLAEQGRQRHEASARTAVSGSTFDTLTPDRQALLTEIQQNTAHGVAGFPQMVTAINNGDMAKAAYELTHNGPNVPTPFAVDVRAGRANSYAASLRWNVLGSPVIVAKNSNSRPADVDCAVHLRTGFRR